MMYFGPRKLLFSQVSLGKTSRILLVDNPPCTCYFFCPDECKNDSGNEHYLSPPPPPPPPPGQNNMPMLLIIMLCILGAAFAGLCYLTVLRRYRSNLRNSRRIFYSFGGGGGGGEGFVGENHGPFFDHPIWHIQTVGLQQSVIDSIPIFKYKKGDGLSLVDGTDCSVCLSEFEEDESLRLLPKCSHAFHINCIDTWLRSHKNCPLCRAPVETTGQSARADVTVDGAEPIISDENGEVGASPSSSIEGESIGPLWDEQGKILERTNNNGIRVFSDLGDHCVRMEQELQPIRRSFSLNLPSASRIYPQVAKIEPVKEEGSSNLDEELEMKKPNSSTVAAKLGNKNSSINRSRKSFSFGRSLQSVPIRMKRSFSSSSKSSLQSSDILIRPC